MKKGRARGRKEERGNRSPESGDGKKEPGARNGGGGRRRRKKKKEKITARLEVEKKNFFFIKKNKNFPKWFIFLDLPSFPPLLGFDIF